MTPPPLRPQRLWSRRPFLWGLSAIAILGSENVSARSNEDLQTRRLNNRIELWSTFARRSKTLVVRYSARRESSLLREPLITTGVLAFAAPSRLVFSDDTNRGSTTSISNDLAVILAANQKGLPQGPAIVPASNPALRWLRDHLVALFAPGDGSALLANARSHAPKGRQPRLELLPPHASPARKVLRSLTVTFDPVGGAILVIDIAEAQGDRIIFRLSDHRQDPEDPTLLRLLNPKT